MKANIEWSKAQRKSKFEFTKSDRYFMWLYETFEYFNLLLGEPVYLP